MRCECYKHHKFFQCEKLKAKLLHFASVRAKQSCKNVQTTGMKLKKENCEKIISCRKSNEKRGFSFFFVPTERYNWLKRFVCIILYNIECVPKRICGKRKKNSGWVQLVVVLRVYFITFLLENKKEKREIAFSLLKRLNYYLFASAQKQKQRKIRKNRLPNVFFTKINS